MEWKLKEKTALHVLACLAIFLLPWQTRWFWEGPLIGGYAWEWGRMALYVSWLPIVLVILHSFIRTRTQTPPSSSDSDAPLIRGGVPVRPPDKGAGGFGRAGRVGIFLLVFSSLFTVFPRATIQWWIEVIILTLFVLALRRLDISRVSVACWFVIALIPHALLGAWQEATQIVIGSSWLGMAAQNPLMRGVSVVESLGLRHLRAYGGFPHPNIFGAWLTIGLIVALAQTLQATRRRVFAIWLVGAGLFATVLIFTLARGAWIAAVLGLVFLFLRTWKKYPSREMRRRFTIVFVGLVLVFAGAIFYEHKRIITRIVSSERLEQRSLDERAQGFENGWRIFREHPLVGVGPRATLFASSASPVLPHFIPLLILDEVGLIGLLGLAILIGVSWRRRDPSLFFPLLVFALTDHFLWSTWSGMSLMAIVIMIDKPPEKVESA